MILASSKAGQGPRWQRVLAQATRSIAELAGELQLDPSALSAAADADFPVRVPEPYLRRIRPGDPQDPLLLQVLPQLAETLDSPGFVTDPLDEAHATPIPGMLHKYRSRVLLILSAACAVHCRYCFRRHFPYENHQTGGQVSPAILNYLRAHPEVDEVILSGGDPLTLSDRAIAAWVDALEEVAQVRRLRIHTRLPIVLPERVTPTLAATFEATRLQTVLVVHANHPRELDSQVADAMNALVQANVKLFNQSVLLRGVNDRVDVLADLSEELFRIGVQPYYLHLLDPVAGAAHFQVDEEQAAHLYDALRARLSGYLVPTLVRETPGAPAKTPVR